MNDQCIGTNVVDIPRHLACALQLIVAQNSVQRDEDAAAKAVGMFHQSLQIADLIARSGACAKAGAADVDGICSVVDGFNANIGIAGRGQEFELVGQERHRGAIIPAPTGFVETGGYCKRWPLCWSFACCWLRAGFVFVL